ncbi:M1 family metallopeptidase (plasmid) [Streptomyces sp. NBC_01450]|uniref:M1 family metallopeptidase n=1 Tax=Streptomyces sp. NBC_01450 TaxID=2903871 RepID=UPI002E35ADE7|nr:M1 family metallopeptidase [Streptomyces sp. NBC_01450]
MRRHLAPRGVVVGVLLLTACHTGSPSGTAAAAQGGPGTGDPYFPNDGNGGYDVSHYDVRVRYDPSRRDHLDGDTIITAQASAVLGTFHLDLRGFDVTSVTVDGEAAGSVKREGAHELVVSPAHTIAENARFAVRVRYSGRPSKEGWHTLTSGGVVALGEPHGATSWFPSNDHPSDKATFQLTATVPDGWTAIGNGGRGRTTTANGRTTFRWREDHPLATYLATVAVDKFTVRSSKLSDGTPVINAYSPDTFVDDETEKQLQEIHDLLVSKFGPYPFSSAGSTVVGEQVDDSGPIDLETQSRPTYNGALFDSAMVHEIAHQWFGDSVSFTDWRDGCIAECFAQYANQLWEEHNGADLDEDFYRSTLEDGEKDAKFWKVRLYDPGKGEELNEALYARGSLMLHALRRTVGDRVFFATLKRWTRDHRYGNASWPQFESLTSEMAGRNLHGFFRAWAHSSTEPPAEYLYPGSLKRHVP